MRVEFLLIGILSVINLAYGRLDILDEWDGGFMGLFVVDLKESVNGWELEFKCDEPIEKIEVFIARVKENEGNQRFVLMHEAWNENLEPGVFQLEFIVRYPAGTERIIDWATFNGEEIHNSGGNPPGTTSTTTSLTTTISTSSTTGGPNPYNYKEVISLSLLFYEAQRSGNLPSNNRIPWRGNSFINDGDASYDLTGGYFDAGDHVKFGFPFAAFTTVMAWGLLDFKDGYIEAGEYENGLDALKWSLDFFMKAHVAPTEFYGQVGDGHADHAFWGRPEDWPLEPRRSAFKITQSAPGSDLAAETAASFAAGYLIFKDSNPAYGSDCLRHAEELYDFANRFRGAYSDSIPNARDFYNSWSGFGDELGWGAAWLYRATNDNKYLTDVRSHWQEFGIGGKPLEFGWDDKKAGVQILMAKITGDDEYVNAARTFCDYIVNEVPRSPKGLAFISQWGALRHVSNAAFVCLQAAEAGINPTVYRQFAKQQMHYILGDTGRSFVIGFGINPPQKPHHRASSCPDRPAACTWDAFNSPNANPQVLKGALVGGPDQNDEYEDKRDDYIKNEVATDYNAGFQSALAGLVSLQSRGVL